MFESMTKADARNHILSEVDEYCKKFHSQKIWKPGERIPYASRVYDSSEMVNLVDSALEFWLTSGRYTELFEKQFASWRIFCKPVSFYGLNIALAEGATDTAGR